jgi:hypothetical protein
MAVPTLRSIREGGEGIMYNITQWKDHIVDQNGNVIQQGTNESALNFNNNEGGTLDNQIAVAILLQHQMQREAEVDGNISDLSRETAAETGTVSLNNTQSYPFNNSKATVPLKTTRQTLNYTVEVLQTSCKGGLSGEIVVSEKTYNGFKVEFTGSATQVTLVYIVKGGFLS